MKSRYACIAALSALLPVAAHADDTAADAQTTTVAATDADTLPTVIVTAEKSGRSLMDTATSTAVLDQRDLDNRGLQSTADVLANTPNVMYVGTGNIAPAIRGVDSTGASQGSDAFIAGSRPRINMQLDGRPLSYNEIIFADTELWDVEQVEVLRGAQSTLQGRNAMAGTIATKTNDPTFDSEGAFRFGGGNYDQRRVSAMLSGPVVGLFGDSHVAFRLAADWATSESANGGYVPYPTVDDVGEFQTLNLRGKLLFEPTSIPGWRTLLTLNHSDYRGPQTESVVRGTSGFGERQTSTDDMPVFTPKSTSAIVDTSYQISDALRFEGLLTGTDIDVDRRANTGDGVATVDSRQYTVEPRLRFGNGERFSGVAGVFLFASDQDETLDFLALQHYDDQVRTAALFGETTIPLGDSPFDLIAGARYEQEKHERHGGVDAGFYRFVVQLDETYKAFLPKLGVAWHVTPQATVGVMASRGYNGGGAGASLGASEATNYQYDPEYVWTYELYGRQELADGRVRLTANLFYSDYKDYQLTFDLTPTDTADYAFVVDNADKVKSYGAEVGATWLVTRGLQVYLNLGTLKTDISQYPGSGYQGHELANAPKLTGSAGISWDGNGWDASFNGRYADSYYSDVANLPRGHVDPYWIANAQLGYTFERAHFYGRVRNVFDSDKPLAVYPGATAAEDVANLPQPRTYWVGVELRW
jgi:outer membrane receptor protein involved in Fe transport